MINRNLYLYLFLSLILNFVFLIIMGVSFNSKNTTDVVVLKDFMSLSENEKIKIDLVKNKMIVNDTPVDGNLIPFDKNTSQLNIVIDL